MTSIQIEQTTEESTGEAGRYAVILHNDEVHSMEFVVSTLLKCVPSLTADEAVAVMFEAHHRGKGTVIVCPRPQAEGTRDRIRSYTLTCSVESA